MTFDIILNWVSEANIIHPFIFVFFRYFSYHSFCRKDQFIAVISKFWYCWFSLDVTKVQTTKLSMLPRFYVYDVLEQLKTNFHTNFCFKRVVGFVIEYAWIPELLGDAPFTWCPREVSRRLKKVTQLFQGIFLSKQFMY